MVGREGIIHSYDRKRYKAIIKTNLSSGEQVAGFRDLNTREFEEVMKIESSKDLDIFLEMYDIAVAEITQG